MSIFLYKTGIRFYVFAVWIASLFQTKAKLWRNGRKNIFEKIEKDVSNIPDFKENKVFWFHVASLGEFEQGRPVMEAIKKKNDGNRIVLTFFSPSGYEVRKNYEFADLISYLPVDTAENAKRFLKIIQPDIAVFVKYEFWYFYLNELNINDIPTYLISANFIENQIFFKRYGNLFRKMLKNFTQIFVQNEASLQLLKSIEIDKVMIGGDTRVDRVLDIAKRSKRNEIVEIFSGKFDILVCGSTWQPDEEILTKYINNHPLENHKFIIAPHEIHESHIENLLKALKVPVVCYSEGITEDLTKAKVLIIDNIGILQSLYFYGKVAYIGGGFGKGIHNTLEPAAFGLPLIFGTKYTKFDEAVQLVKRGGAFSIKNYNDFENIFEKLNDTGFYENASKMTTNYLNENKGATEKILKFF